MRNKMEEELKILKHKLELEKAARKDAEFKLEKKSIELIAATKNLCELDDENKSLSKNLTTQTEFQKNLIDNLVDSLFVIDLDGNFLKCNKEACNLIGVTKENLPKSINEFSNLNKKRIFSHFNKDSQNQKDSEFKFQFYNRKKEHKFVAVKWRLLLDSCNQPYAYQAMVRDLTSNYLLDLKLKRQDEIKRYEAAILKDILTSNDIFNNAWSLVNHIASYLKTDDCVFYGLVNNKLIQLAATGNKIDTDKSIKNRLEIPLNHGVVGRVASTKNGAIIQDTSKEENYIVDDVARRSEITVPILLDDQLIGVLDSEHPEKGHYKKYHLEFLSRISSLIAFQIKNSVSELEKKLKQDELEKTRKRLEIVFNSDHNAEVIESIDGYIIDVGEGFLKMFNIPISEKSDLIGMKCSDARNLLKDLFIDAEAYEKIIDERLANAEPVLAEILELKDGRYLARDYVPVFFKGKLESHVWRMRDVTLKVNYNKSLKAQNTKYKNMIDNMKLGLLEVDNDDVILAVNSGFTKMSGYEEKELIGKKAKEILLKESDRIIIDKKNKDRKKKFSDAYEIEITNKNGESRFWLISGNANIDINGNVIGSMGIHYDISDRKKIEQELKLSKKAAEKARDAEKQFLARMSHEIRTPLNAIIGMSHLLSATSTTSEQDNLVKSIKTSGDLLLNIVSDILDISKIEANEININKETFNLQKLIHTLQKTFQVKIDQEQVSLSYEIDEKIENLLIGDKLLLTQILLNLISNAVKFTKAGTIKIIVKLLTLKDENYLLEFEVSDTGVGIKEEKLELIFENFKQANDRIRHEFGGTGLGLAISKKFVNLQGGEIWAESKVGKGSSFKFTIKYLDSGVKEIKEDGTNDEALKIVFKPSKMCILIVEDNLMNRKYITTLLRKWGIRFHVAVNGKEATEMTKENHYDLIFMDVSMPIMDGYEATIRIRNEENPNKKSPIIALTASTISSKKDKAIKLGMTDYIPKPFAPAQLLETIRKYTNRQEESTINPIEVKVKSEKEILDLSYLQRIYGEDHEHAAEMFDIFLSYTVQELPSLRNFIEHGNWGATKSLAHRIKPNFSMVGLTQLEKKMLAIEKMAQKEKDPDSLINFMNEIESKLEEAKPFLITQMENYKSQINK